MKVTKWDKIIHETYELLFKASEPSVDFNDLLANAIINEDGKKDINFMNYEIDEDIMKEIIESQIKRYKMNILEQRTFNINIYLGCSPKTKQSNYESKTIKT